MPEMPLKNRETSVSVDYRSLPRNCEVPLESHRGKTSETSDGSSRRKLV